ncbi:hypothetical protein PPERSA_11525 [Pseudocohnilembus persalinus]|uniref:Uncharacterized protein n=1 Tax=Pseudocohnilembus persalinus TaxID=266149 RepID=A0A0V0QXV5_PSEPJ|nr:hypothetical protein PPERSA_11525 [Pseudocohnilembus persalinus]|eukprot:KRX06880.1 hypothetical protein PPERSA_11525 [Pseudocohnilembus persalinus]
MSMKPFNTRVDLGNYDPLSEEQIDSPRSLFVLKQLNMKPQDLQVPDLKRMKKEFLYQNSGVKFEEFKKMQVERTFKKLKMCQLQINFLRSNRSFSSNNGSPLKKSSENVKKSQQQKKFDDFQNQNGLASTMGSFATTAATSQRFLTSQTQNSFNGYNTVYNYTNQSDGCSWQRQMTDISKSLDVRGLNQQMSEKFKIQVPENNTVNRQKKIVSARLQKSNDSKMKQVENFKKKQNKEILQKQKEYQIKQNQIDQRIQQREKQMEKFWNRKKQIEELFQHKTIKGNLNNMNRLSKVEYKINKEAKSHGQKYCNSKFVQKIKEINSQNMNKIIKRKIEDLKILNNIKPVFFKYPIYNNVQTNKKDFQKNRQRSCSSNGNYQNQVQNQNFLCENQIEQNQSPGLEKALFGTRWTGEKTKFRQQSLGFDKGVIYIYKSLDFRYDNPKINSSEIVNKSQVQQQWW